MRLPPLLLGLACVCVGTPAPVPAQQPAAPPAIQLPAVRVSDGPVPGENKIIGTYGQPEWSARRPFPGVSVYVVPAGEYEFESGLDAQSFAGATAVRRRWTQEVEIGLGRRVQLAVEHSLADFSDDGRHSAGWHRDSLALALRCALADWGRLPLNPALSAGWRDRAGAAGAWQFGAVFGDELTPRWHWAANLWTERRRGAAGAGEFTGDAALSYSVANETLNLGVQGGWRASRDLALAPADYLRGGPCLQFRPWDEFHLNAVCLWSDRSRGAPRREILISVGFEFGEGADDHDREPRRGGKFDR